MGEALRDLLATAPVVTVVGLSAVVLLCVDLVRRELADGHTVTLHPRWYGLALACAFVVLAALRFREKTH